MLAWAMMYSSEAGVSWCLVCRVAFCMTGQLTTLCVAPQDEYLLYPPPSVASSSVCVFHKLDLAGLFHFLDKKKVEAAEHSLQSPVRRNNVNSKSNPAAWLLKLFEFEVLASTMKRHVTHEFAAFNSLICPLHDGAGAARNNLCHNVCI